SMRIEESRSRFDITSGDFGLLGILVDPRRLFPVGALEGNTITDAVGQRSVESEVARGVLVHAEGVGRALLAVAALHDLVFLAELAGEVRFADALHAAPHEMTVIVAVEGRIGHWLLDGGRVVRGVAAGAASGSITERNECEGNNESEDEL
ncbi:hypothetical protein PENTCL1PPCAC_21380, partial [Pristionchus entomophagus]